MKAVIIENIKEYMEKLLLSTRFDSMHVSKAQLTTDFSVIIDGKRRKSYYDTGDEQDSAVNLPYITWGEIKNKLLFLIKGKRSPLLFSVSFFLKKDDTAKLLKYWGLTEKAPDIAALNLNLLYKDNTLTLVFAVTHNGFSADNSVDRCWDEYAEKHIAV